MTRRQKKIERLSRKLDREEHRFADSDIPAPTFDPEDKADVEIERENTLIWAYYRASEWTQREVVETVIDEPDERPTQSQISRIIKKVSEDILQRNLSLGETEMSGQWFSDKINLENVPEPQQELVKETLARFIVTADVAEALYWPESSTTAEDVPEWAVGDVDPLEIKADQYWRGGFDKDNLPPSVRRRVAEVSAGD